MAHSPPRAGQGEVVLNNIPLKVGRGGIDVQIVNISGRKVNLGDPGPDDHPVNSTFVMRNWIGGGQVRRNNPAQDTDRFWWGDVLSQYPGALTLPVLTSAYATPSGLSGTVWVHGDFAGQTWASWGTALRKNNPTGDVWDGGVTLTSPPAGRGKVFVPRTGALAGTAHIFIPLGSSHDYWDGAAGAVTNSGEDAIWFEVWDDKLFKLDATGLIRYTIDGTTWLDIGTSALRIPDGSTPRRLVGYYDEQGRTSLHVTTNAGLWVLNYDQEVLQLTDLQYPLHPHQGKAASNWRGDLYVAVGTGAHRTNGSLISPVGLDRDNGLPPEFHGHIVDFAPEYNGLYALVQGQTAGAGNEETFTHQVGDETTTFYADATVGSSLVAVWNGYGWHYVKGVSGAVPTSIVITVANDRYRLLFAAGGKVWQQNLSAVYFNPLEQNEADYEEEGTFESSWINWGWLGMPKVLKLIELKVNGDSATEYVEVAYKVDNDDNPWVLAGTCNGSDTDGEYHFKVGPDGDHYVGVEHEQVKIQLRFRRGSDVQLHPVVEWFSLSCRKVLRPIRTYRFQATVNETYKSTTKGGAKQEIVNLLSTNRAVPFVHGDDTLMVDVVSVGFNDRPGPNKSFTANISLIESFELDIAD